MKLRVGTYNVCHCGDYESYKDGDDLPIWEVTIEKTAKAISDMDLDIIGLNEVFLAGEREDFCNQTEKLAKAAGYPYCASAAGKDYGWTTIGNGLLSKYPIVNVQKILIPVPTEEERYPNEDDWWEDRVLLVVDIDVEGSIQRVISTHFGLNLSEQERIVGQICKIVDESASVILMGDFNALPDAKILAPIYARLKSTAKETGNTEFTWAAYAPQVQIDYIFVPKSAKIEKYEVNKARASDHYPILAEIEL